MSSRKHSLAAQIRVVKRLLGRRNLDLLQPIKPSAKTLEHGGFKVRDAASGKIVFGEEKYEFSATLEEVEAWIEAQLG
ncbi:MAG: hypothetical protein ABIQ30_13215 [Devosia sp.]